MSRRALTTWMLRQQEVNRLLSMRHAMVARPEPGRRMLQALGLAPEEAERDVRPRRLVRPTRVFEPRPVTLAADMRSPRVSPASDHAAAAYAADAPLEHSDLVESQPSELVAQSSVASSANESPPVAESIPTKITPEIGLSDVTRAFARDESSLIEERPPAIAAAAKTPGPTNADVGTTRPAIDSHQRPTHTESATPTTPPPTPAPTLTPASEEQPLVAAVIGSEPPESVSPRSAVARDSRSSEAPVEEVKAPPAPANATSFVEQRQARRPLAARVGTERAAHESTDRAHDHPGDADAPRLASQHVAPEAVETAKQEAEAPPSHRSPLEWMQLLVEATTEPASVTRGAAQTAPPRPIVRHPGAPRAATPAPAGPAAANPRIAPAVANEQPKRESPTTPRRVAAPRGPSVPPRPPIEPSPLSSAPAVGPTLRGPSESAPAQISEPESALQERVQVAAPDALIVTPPTATTATPALVPSSRLPDQPELPIQERAAADTDAVEAKAAVEPRTSPPPRTAPTLPKSPERIPTAAPTLTPPDALSRDLSSLPTPSPLAPSTRRFLKPLVGIDPETVRVHRGPAVADIAARQNADAVTVGEEIVLAEAHDETRPSTLGVLAHELTHVARARQPRFVPPVAHGAAPADRSPLQSPPNVTEREPASADEEPLALRVEGAVRHAARREAGSTIDSPRVIPASIEPAVKPTHRAPGAEQRRGTHEPVLPTAEDEGGRDASPWGGLPAPWEPLPESLTRMSTSANGASGNESSGGTGGFASAAPSAVAPAASPAVQAAARDRNLPEQSPETPAAASGEQRSGASPSPDIDALARQVYDVLKRRLAAERRRGV